jgi:hypothetical protein
MCDPSRRLLLGVALALGASPALAADPARDLVEKAIARAGGRAALERAKVLAWTGEAVVHVGDRTIELGVDTTVRPFDYAHGTSWLKAEGPGASRALLIEGDKGTLVRQGVSSPMPQAMRRHETQQYAVYGLMRLLPLLERGVALKVVHDDGGLAWLEAAHPKAPFARLGFDADGRLARLSDTVVSPDGGADIAQVFTFEGEITGGGVRWPRKLSIVQDGKPFFDLTLSTFSPRETL